MITRRKISKAFMNQAAKDFGFKNIEDPAIKPKKLQKIKEYIKQHYTRLQSRKPQIDRIPLIWRQQWHKLNNTPDPRNKPLYQRGLYTEAMISDYRNELTLKEQALRFYGKSPQIQNFPSGGTFGPESGIRYFTPVGGKTHYFHSGDFLCETTNEPLFPNPVAEFIGVPGAEIPNPWVIELPGKINKETIEKLKQLISEPAKYRKNYGEAMREQLEQKNEHFRKLQVITWFHCRKTERHQIIANRLRELL